MMGELAVELAAAAKALAGVKSGAHIVARAR